MDNVSISSIDTPYFDQIGEEHRFEGKKRKGKSDLMSPIEDQINRKTVIAGASKKWDEKRLRVGKLPKLEAIGGVPLLLTTQSKDHISALFFPLHAFLEKIKAFGGMIAELRIHLNHIFFDLAEPVRIYTVNAEGVRGSKSHPAVRIPYHKSLQDEFKTAQDFINFCSQMKVVPVWEDTLKPFSFPPRKQNILLIPTIAFLTMTKNLAKSNDTIQIEKSDSFDNSLSIFSREGLSAHVIAFDNNSKNIKSLFEDLKIDDTPYEMVEMDGKIFMIEKNQTNLSYLAGVADSRNLKKFFLFGYEVEPVKQPTADGAGTVVLSMNQSNSFTQYTHEILTFLLEGVNVLVYDNAGKGLSTGSNSEQGLKEAVEICGDYLLHMGFKENQIMFKGQCAGGLPSSEAAKTFPNSHVWIDQSPQNFSGAAEDLFVSKVKSKVEKKKKNAMIGPTVSLLESTSLFFSPVISFASSLFLPSFDVVHNLERNQGVQMYTIGVPDAQGNGGDELVPLHHREAIRHHLSTNPNGIYLPMMAATHVTDWWIDPITYQTAHNILGNTNLSRNLFPPQKKQTNKEIVDEHFEKLLDKLSSPISARKTEVSLYQLLEYVISGEVNKVIKEINLLKGCFSSNDMVEVFKICLSLAKKSKNKQMIFLLIEAKNY